MNRSALLQWNEENRNRWSQMHDDQSGEGDIEDP